MAHIEKRGPKRWRARYRGPDGKERSKTFDRRVDAERFLTSVEASKLEGRWIDPRLGKTPASEWAEQCLGARMNLRPATRARDLSLVRNHLLPWLGETPIARLTKIAVQEWVSALSGILSPTTVRECYRLLGGIMGEAVEHRLIPESPCRRISLPRVERVERRFLSPDEVEGLVSASTTGQEALIYTAAYLGARWEELAALRRSRLDLLRKQVRIAATIERVGGTYRYVEDTKTEASRRTLRLPRFLVDVLAHHLEGAPVSDYVFAAPEGGFLRYDNYRHRVWLPAVKEADLEPLTFHELRHTAAAIMVDQGADPLQVQRRLGHKDIRTTLGLYGHLFPNRENDLNDSLELVFQDARTRSLAASPRPDVIDLRESREAHSR